MLALSRASIKKYTSYEKFSMVQKNCGNTEIIFPLFLLPQSDGCQKIRWAVGSKGKSAGVRVIYYVVAPKGRIYLLLIYAKNEQDNLTTEQRHIMKKLVEKLGGVNNG